MVNYYQILGVSENATQTEIRASYKKLVIKYHPDKNRQSKIAEEKLKVVNNAYYILSDPYKKSQYDTKLQYNRFSNFQFGKDRRQHNNTYQQSYKYTNANKDKNYKTSSYSEEKSNTIISFTVIGIMATLVLLTTWIENYYREMKKEIILQKKEELMAVVQSYYQRNNYRATLEKLEQIHTKYPEFYIFIDFKFRLIDEIKKIAEINFLQGNYWKAIEYFTILNDFNQKKKISYDHIIIDCYMALSLYNEALLIIEKFLKKDSTDIRACLQKANVLSHLEKYFESLSYYNKAADLAIDYYMRRYGKAFIILVQPAIAPDIHYDVFIGRAKVQAQLENYQKVIEDCNWASYLRPKKSVPFLYKGNSYYKKGKINQACQNWKKSVLLGNKTAEEKIQKYCQ